jgi:signal transduction histidine kinase
MPRSLRSTLILASLLWTAGLLMFMHMLSLLLIHVFPRFRGHEVLPLSIAFGLMVAGVLLLRRGLAPFARLRRRLSAVHTGQQRRVEGVYPAEVQPLIDDLNLLLEAREKAVQRAVATAGDLAHGLKTPLALLQQEVQRASEAGQSELAESIAQQVHRMDRQVDYHLARARAAASGASGARCPVGDCADALVRTLQKLYTGRALRIVSHVAPGLCVRAQREDLDEMLGNLLDNACKWAAVNVVLEASSVGNLVMLTVADDGPGLAPALREAALERGVRLDEAAPGSGLGLAIVRDLAELYGGSVTLEDSRLGGLQARLSLPVC